MRRPVRSRLTTLITAALVAGSGWAQDSDPPKQTLYTTVDEHEIYLIVGDEQFDLKTGESAFVDNGELEFVAQAPAFVNWPCGTDLDMGRGSLTTYSLDSLPAEGAINEVVSRFFEEEARVPEGHPRWLNGASHGKFPIRDIEALVTRASWYNAGPPDALMAYKRPDVLIISLYRGTGQAVVDTNFLDELKDKYPDGDIPVFFDFRNENEVPISYFGRNPSVDMLIEAFTERNIVPASVPMWYAGDMHVELSPRELADRVAAPPADDISPQRMAELQAELNNKGLSLKPFNLVLTQGSDLPRVDAPDRLRAAVEMGLRRVPVVTTFYTDSSHADHCGLPPQVAALGALGTTNPDAAAVTVPDPYIPDQAVVDPPPVSGN